LALARADQSVLLMDVNWGTGSLEMLCGLNGRWNFSHALDGTHRLDEVLLDGPARVKILSRVGNLAEAVPSSHTSELWQQLAQLRQEFQFVVIDLGPGMARNLPTLMSIVGRVINVTTTEPTSIAEAYATMKSLAGMIQPKWDVLVNQSEQLSQAETIFQRLKQTTRVFLKTELGWAGSIPSDTHVTSAVFRRNPFLLEHPQCEASQAIKHLARRLINQSESGTYQHSSPSSALMAAIGNRMEDPQPQITAT
ncbi:MAG: hypothetical protein KDA84_00375, partial [Planctomycetaceae bacterium]|nr:hypothetical protein [Planctomycetaceae bacterium]